MDERYSVMLLRPATIPPKGHAVISVARPVTELPDRIKGQMAVYDEQGNEVDCVPCELIRQGAVADA